MPEIEWLQRWEKKHPQDEQHDEVANMNVDDYEALLEEIEHR